jgi:hypothetical protein
VKAPLKKVFLARYVLLLEIGGYLAVGVLIAGIVYSNCRMVDDVCKLSADAVVTPRIEVIALERPSFVRDVRVDYGEEVEKGQCLFTIAAHSPEIDTLVIVRRYFEEARGALNATTASLAASPALRDLTLRGIAGTDALRSAPTTTVLAPMAGEVTAAGKQVAGLRRVAETIMEGPVVQVCSYGALRFAVPVSGKNADRVRINQLAVLDVRDWKTLTRSIRAKDAPDSPGERRVWERLKGRLADVKPNRVPPKNKKADVVAALAEILAAPDFYDPNVWNPSRLSPEARYLVRKGVPNLTFEERVRLNRLVLEGIFPGAIAKSKNSRQPVKARILVPQAPQTADGARKGAGPKVFPMTGEVISERQGGNVTVDLPNPNPQLVAYLRKCASDANVPAPDFRGSVVIDRISAFRFLFRKE